MIDKSFNEMTFAVIGFDVFKNQVRFLHKDLNIF